MGRIVKTLRRMVTRPDHVHVIYDKEGTAINPRPPGHVYAPIARVLSDNEGAILAVLEDIRPQLCAPGIEAVPHHGEDPTQPYWDNGYFSFLDARVAYGLTVRGRPARIVEIGSGNSTKFFRKAVTDGALDCRITSIDPQPRAEIGGVCDRLIRKNVLEVEMALFSELEADDILFIDGSHYVFNGTDTTRIFLEILPTLRRGVLVHVHDICLPYEYNDLFTERMYAEQYLLACLLLNTAEWRPVMPVYYLEATGHFAGFPAATVPNTSFWLRRV